MKEKIVMMVMNGAGTRDTGRVLGVSKDTVTATLKTEKCIKQVNEDYLTKVKTENPIDIDICQTLSAEMDEMWSFYHDKSHQLWLWWAVDHATNTPLAFTFGYCSAGNPHYIVYAPTQK